MTISILWWVLFILAAAFDAWSSWPNYKTLGGNLIWLALIGLLGWKVFPWGS